MVNDISAGRDPDTFGIVADAGRAMTLMHMAGNPATMQQNPHYNDVLDEVSAFFDERIQAAIASGLSEDALILDPGIGFGKTAEHNRQLLNGLDVLTQRFGRPLLVGISRKRLLADLTSRELPPTQRDAASSALHALLAWRCSLLRVHDVPAARDAIRLAAACARVPA